MLVASYCHLEQKILRVRVYPICISHPRGDLATSIEIDKSDCTQDLFPAFFVTSMQAKISRDTYLCNLARLSGPDDAKIACSASVHQRSAIPNSCSRNFASINLLINFAKVSRGLVHDSLLGSLPFVQHGWRAGLKPLK